MTGVIGIVYVNVRRLSELLGTVRKVDRGMD